MATVLGVPTVAMSIIWLIATVLFDYVTALPVATMSTIVTGFGDVTSLLVTTECLA
jgi:hypothetical protein